jgi:hypothetical protein
MAQALKMSLPIKQAYSQKKKWEFFTGLYAEAK